MKHPSTRWNPAILSLTACFITLAACERAASPVSAEDTPFLAMAKRPVEVAFEKQLNLAASQFDGDGNPIVLVWNGTVDGLPGSDLVSTIDFQTPGTRSAGKTLHATVVWEISTPDGTFVAETEGVVNFQTGLVRTNGIVTAGLRAGARVHQEGRLDDQLSAVGFLRILP
jgi:hypothetical protein